MGQSIEHGPRRRQESLPEALVVLTVRAVDLPCATSRSSVTQAGAAQNLSCERVERVGLRSRGSLSWVWVAARGGAVGRPGPLPGTGGGA